MLRDGVINGQLASVLARFRHVNTLAIVDGPFPSYPGVEIVDLAVIKGQPTIPEILDAILPLMDLTGLYLANEFDEKVDPKTVAEYKSHYADIPKPEFYDEVERPAEIRVKALNLDGEEFEIEADGLLAVCLQHELDHLEGKVFVEYLSMLKQVRISQKMKKRIKELAGKR